MKPNSDLKPRIDRFGERLMDRGILPATIDVVYHRNGATLTGKYKLYGRVDSVIVVEFPHFGNWVCINYASGSVSYRDTQCDWFPDWLVERLRVYGRVWL